MYYKTIITREKFDSLDTSEFLENITYSILEDDGTITYYEKPVPILGKFLRIVIGFIFVFIILLFVALSCYLLEKYTKIFVGLGIIFQLIILFYFIGSLILFLLSKKD